MEGQARTLSGINVLAGIWLIISPFVLSYSVSGNMWQEFIFGIAVTLLALIRLFSPKQTWASWLNFAIGLWMIIAPWAITGTTQAAKWSQVIAGIVIAVLAFISTQSTEEPEEVRGHVTR